MIRRLRREEPAGKEQQVPSAGSADEPFPADEIPADTVAGEGFAVAELGERSSAETRRRIGVDVSWARVVTYAVLPAIALLLAGCAAWLKWQETNDRKAAPAGVEAVQRASDGAVAMLSYGPSTAEEDLGEVRDLMSGALRDTYTSLTRDVVIPAAEQKQVTARAEVPAAAVVSADESRVVVLLSINQTVTVGDDTPSATTSSVRVTLDKIGDGWLISDFTPI